MTRGGCIYFLTNKNNNVLYVGVTSDLQKRILEHKNKHYTTSFTARYNCDKLVYYETFNSIEEAIAKEKAIKKWKREWKNRRVYESNPEWKDLTEEVMLW